MKNDGILVVLSALRSLHRSYSLRAKEVGLKLKELVLRAMLSLNVSNVVVGNDSLAQLKENITSFERGPLPWDLMKTLKQIYEEPESCLITPNLWTKKMDNK